MVPVPAGKTSQWLSIIVNWPLADERRGCWASWGPTPRNQIGKTNTKVATRPDRNRAFSNQAAHGEMGMEIDVIRSASPSRPRKAV
jgi:hypothetical protein